jgi:hypothetical protein
LLEGTYLDQIRKDVRRNKATGSREEDFFTAGKHVRASIYWQLRNSGVLQIVKGHVTIYEAKTKIQTTAALSFTRVEAMTNNYCTSLFALPMDAQRWLRGIAAFSCQRR